MDNKMDNSRQSTENEQYQSVYFNVPTPINLTVPKPHDLTLTQDMEFTLREYGAFDGVQELS